MNRRPVCLLEGEDGRSLPAVLIALTVGVLLITPLLSGSSTGLLGTRAADQALLEQFSLDSGVEFAIWRLRYDPTFRALVDSVPLTPRDVGMGAVNGYTPGVTATALYTLGWSSRANTRSDIDRGGALTFGGGDYLFALRGDDFRTFWRYSIPANSWEPPLANTPNTVREGGALTWDGGNFVYALRGRNSRGFWRFNGTSWASLANAPGNVRWGGALASANGVVYALRGNGSNDFWCYTPPPPPLGVWTCAGADPPDPTGVNFDGGAALVYAGGNVLYALEGGGSRGFWRYSTSGGGSWTQLLDTPADVDTGGGLAYPGGDFIYALGGAGTTNFWKYSISGNSWTPETNTPASVSDGGALAYAGGDYVYALRGGGNRDFWQFRVAPPEYDIVAQSGSRTIASRIQIAGTNVTILFWDIQ